MFTSRITAVAVTAVLAFGGGLAPTAAQAAQGQGSDHTRLVLKQSVFEILQDKGVEAAPFGGADAYLFKGTLAVHLNEVSQRRGVLRHNGGFVLKGDSGRVGLRRFIINTNRERVTAVVNGRQRVRVFKVISPSRRPQLGRLRFNLTGVAAAVLNDALGTNFKRGDTFTYATAFGRDED